LGFVFAWQRVGAIRQTVIKQTGRFPGLERVERFVRLRPPQNGSSRKTPQARPVASPVVGEEKAKKARSLSPPGGAARKIGDGDYEERSGLQFDRSCRYRRILKKTVKLGYRTDTCDL
jgi:hypothetical protein